jgi:hypothetical protein
MSVWRDVEALFEFVYKSMHRLVMAKRREWFDQPSRAYQVLWWVKADAMPTVEDGLARLRYLQEHGPTAQAFTFKHKFPRPGMAGQPEDLRPEPYCVGWQ